jgi:hypothetical protein
MLYDIFLVGGTILSIHLISTIPERLIFFTVLVLIFYQISKRLVITKRKWLISVAVAGVLTLLCGIYLTTTVLVYIPVIFIIIVLILFLFSMGLTLAMNKKLFSAIVAGIITLVISSNDLTNLHRFLLADQAVEKFAKSHFNSMGMDTDRHILYAIGEGTNHVHAYSTEATNDPPKLSEVETGGAETAFLYSARSKEIYNYNTKAQQLNILDSTSLKLKESIPIQISPGNNWIEMDPHTGYIIVVSEGSKSKGDLENDIHTVLVHSVDRKVVKKLKLHATNILLHPNRPLLYMSQFRNISNEIIIYDLASLEIINKKVINERMDRMAYLESTNELLVTIPIKSKIHRLDADTLALKGNIKSSFGVRTMAVDTKRNLLLTVSLVTNILDVIDLNTYQSLKRYYLAPWLRSIVLDGNGTAYVSGYTGLFRVNYAK